MLVGFLIQLSYGLLCIHMHPLRLDYSRLWPVGTTSYREIGRALTCVYTGLLHTQVYSFMVRPQRVIEFINIDGLLSPFSRLLPPEMHRSLQDIMHRVSITAGGTGQWVL